jgi:hypothetical protein
VAESAIPNEYRQHGTTGVRSGKTENFRTTDVWEETPTDTEGNNGPRRQAAAIPEEEKDCRDGQRRVELGTAVTSGKKRTTYGILKKTFCKHTDVTQE